MARASIHIRDMECIVHLLRIIQATAHQLTISSYVTDCRRPLFHTYQHFTWMESIVNFYQMLMIQKYESFNAKCYIAYDDVN